MRATTRPSPWLDDWEPAAGARSEDLETDVAVVGAGYAGLCTALELRREGLDVAVLEAEAAGFGASGRNAGHLTPTIGKDLPTLTRLFGRDRVRGLVHLADTAIQYVEDLIRSHDVDCQYEPVGNVVAAVDESQYANLDRAAKAAAEYGVPGEILEPDEMRRRGLPRRFLRGYLEPHGGILHPGRYVRALRRLALDAGAVLREATRVDRIESAPSVVVHTARGRVRCRHVVIATNAFSPAFGWLGSAVLPMAVQLFRTAPLTAEQMERIDWHGREGIYTAHEMLESYRLTSDNRIVGGAKYPRYGFAGAPIPDCDAVLARTLEDIFRQRFPELPDLEVTDHWGGPIAFALDFLPVIERDRNDSRVIYAISYAGHGIALASYAGRMAADLIFERDGPGAALWSRRRLPLPPEPLRWLIVRGLTGVFGWIDARVDRRAGGRR